MLNDSIFLSLKDEIKHIIYITPIVIDDLIDDIYDRFQYFNRNRNSLQYLDIDIINIKEEDLNIVSRKEIKNVSTACISVLIGVIIGCISLCLAHLSIEANKSRALANRLLATAGQDIITGFEVLIENIANAKGLLITAQAIAALFLQIITVFSLKAFFSAMVSVLPWYRWVAVGASAIAQITIWLDTEGFALVAEIVLMVQQHKNKLLQPV